MCVWLANILSTPRKESPSRGRVLELIWQIETGPEIDDAFWGFLVISAASVGGIRKKTVQVGGS